LVQPNQPQNSGRRDAKDGGGFTDGHLVAPVSFSLTVDRNSMAVAQRANMPRRPDLPMCCAALIPIQNCGDPRIWFDPRQCANNFHEIIVGDIAMPTSADLLKLYLRVIFALPMQHEAYGLALRRSNDLFQRDTKEPFLVFRRTLRIIPKSGEIPCKGQQFPFLRVAEWALAALLQCRERRFEVRLGGQRLVPTAFEFCGHEPIRRIYPIILAPCACHFVARLL
jgi:hypothetical protein